MNQNMMIIGITGTLGAGKGTIVDFLVNKKNFTHFSARGYILEVMKKRGLEGTRDNLVMVANELREKNSPSFIIDELYKKALENGKNCIIESIRTAGEIDSLRKKDNFILLAVDADQEERYRRVIKRSTSTDNVSLEKFISDELKEMESDDLNKQNLKKCISMADFCIDNNGTIEELNKKIEEILKI